MKKPKHAPEPYRVASTAVPFRSRTIRAGHRPIADVYSESDADLLAAAPELYKACSLAFSAICNAMSLSELRDARDALSAALDKAERGQ